MKKVLITIFVITYFILLNGMTSFGAPKPPPIPSDKNAPIQTFDDIMSLFDDIAYYIAVIFWIFATVAVFYAGYLFLFSGGVEEKINKAKKTIFYAIIAIVLGLMAYALPGLVCSFLKGGACNGSSPQPSPSPSIRV